MTSSNNTMHRLRDVARTFSRLQRRTFSSCAPRSETACLAITALAPGEAVSVSELSARIGSDVPWTSRTIEQLSRSGLITRQDGAPDRRRVLVQLTAAGSMESRRLQAALNAQADSILARLPEERRAAALEALDWLLAALRAEERGEAATSQQG